MGRSWSDIKGYWNKYLSLEYPCVRTYVIFPNEVTDNADLFKNCQKNQHLKTSIYP